MPPLKTEGILYAFVAKLRRHLSGLAGLYPEAMRGSQPLNIHAQTTEATYQSCGFVLAAKRIEQSVRTSMTYLLASNLLRLSSSQDVLA